MKKQTFLRICSLALAAVSVFSIFGCVAKEIVIEDTSIKIGNASLEDFSIVYPEDASEELKAATVSLQSKLKELYQVEVPLISDYSQTGSANGKEFLIGATNREASNVELKYSDYYVEATENKIIIAGGNQIATIDAVTWFMENSLKENQIETANLPYNFDGTYQYQDVFLNNQQLKSYALKNFTGEAYDIFAVWMGENVGIDSSQTAERYICLERDESFLLQEMRLFARGDDVILAVSPHLADMNFALDYFSKLVKQSDGEVVLPKKKDVIDMDQRKSTLTPAQEAGGYISMVGGLDKQPSAYGKNQNLIFSCALLSDYVQVSCHHFTWKAEFIDGGEIASGRESGNLGMFTARITTGDLKNFKITIHAYQENGSEIKVSAVDGAYVFQVIFKDEADEIPVTPTGSEYGFWKTSVTQKPVVFAVERNYQIFVPTNTSELMYVKVGDTFYYDNSCGILKSSTAMHKITVPMEALDAAGSYTIYSQKMVERKAYNPVVEAATTKNFTFKPVKGDNINIYQVADAHGLLTPVREAAEKFRQEKGSIDVLILNGDLISSCDKLSDFNLIYELGYGISEGQIPVIFSRGNHDLRGKVTEKLTDFTPVSSVGKTYYTVRLGSLWAVLVDAAEDKYDAHPEYGGTVAFHPYRVEQIAFLKNVVANANTEYNEAGVKHRLVISHFDFHWDVDNPTEQSTYDAWLVELNKMKIDCCLEGHWHKYFIQYPGDAMTYNSKTRKNPANFVVVIGSWTDYKNFGGAGLCIKDKEVSVIFNTGAEVTKNQVIIKADGTYNK